mmetsp:Transcript_101585/g.296137  ORF Transcript_101585/g.296137 Transcript_101585/m.296137 type:complete len:201 (+) Transcript_101585:998-1600(+)
MIRWTEMPPEWKMQGKAGVKASKTSCRCSGLTSAVRFSTELKELTILLCSPSRSSPPSSAPTLGIFQYPPSQAISNGCTLTAALYLLPTFLYRAKATRIVPSNFLSEPSMATGIEWQQRSATKTGHSFDHQWRCCSSMTSSHCGFSALDMRVFSHCSIPSSKGGDSSCLRTSSSSTGLATTMPAPRDRLQSFSTTAPLLS